MSRLHLLTATVLGFSAVACGSSDNDGGNEGAGGGDSGAMPGIGDTGYPYCNEDSPAGEPCEDSWGAVMCPTETDYPGNAFALCNQGEEKGLYLHYGPRDYDDPDNVEHFLLPAGGEIENCTYAITPNETAVYVKSYRGRMRPNSHHLILRTDDAAPWVENDIPQDCDFTQLVGGRWLVGSQDPQIDIAVGGGLLGSARGDTVPEPGDPDYQLGQRIDPHTKVQIDMHYTNPTNETILREAWVWFDYVDEAHVDNLVDMITFFQGSIDVQPQQSFTTQRAACVAPTDRYVGLITGHAHGALTRFSVWHQPTGGAQSLVYETYDWEEPGNLFYRDGLQNPVANPQALTHGGSSGYLFVKAGEALTFECEYFNTTDAPLSLGEKAGDEMCNVFGMYYPTDGNIWNCVCLDQNCF
jgi:hypothetical protein